MLTDKEIDGREWMTTSQLSAYLGFNRETITKLREEGMPYITGPSVMRPVYRYNRADVDVWLKGRRNNIKINGRKR